MNRLDSFPVRSIITFCLLLVFPIPGIADTIVLKSGERIYADSTQEHRNRVEYSIGDNVMSIPRSIVGRIEKGATPPPRPAPAPAAVAEPPAMREEITIPADVAARIIKHDAVDIAALKAIEAENVPAQSAAANAFAANFEERRNNFDAAARYLQAALIYQPDSAIVLENYAGVLLR